MNEPLVLTDDLLRRALEQRMAHSPSPLLLDRVVAAAGATPQQRVRRLRPSSRVLPGIGNEAGLRWNGTPALAFAMAVVVVAVAAVVAFRPVITGPGGSPSSPVATPSPRPSLERTVAPEPTPQVTFLGTHSALRLQLGSTFEAIDPIDVTFADNSIWTAEIHGNDVRRYDPATLERVATVAITTPGGGPAWFASTPGALWVTNQLGNGVTRIDPATNEVVTTLGSGGTCGAPVVAFAAVWQSICDSDTILRIDTATNAVETIPARGHSFLVAAGDALLTIDGTALATFDPVTRQFKALPTSLRRVDMLLGWDGATVWMTADDAVVRVDPNDGHVVATFAFQDVRAATFADGHAWVTVGDVGKGAAAIEIDLATSAEIQRIPLAGSPLVPLEAEGALFVTDFDNSSLWRIVP